MKIFENPSIEIMTMEVKDVITTSGTIADKVGEDTEEGWSGLQ